MAYYTLHSLWSHFTIWFKTIGGMYIGWIGIHYAASHLYVEYCVPKTIVGFLISPFLTSTTYCSAFRWAIHNGANEIQSMWLLLGSWITFHLFFHNKESIEGVKPT
jgi:hypothetical protein